MSNRNSPIKMVIVLTLTACIAAFVLAFVHGATKDAIEEAYRQDFVRGLKAALPSFTNEPDREAVDVNGTNVYPAKRDGEIIAYAVQATSPKGYGGDIVVLVGVDLDGKLTGIEIIRHAETPGLGDKITADDFRQSFVGLEDASVIMVKKDGGVIDQFSGATISPRAVTEAVREGLTFVQDSVLSEVGK